MKTTTSTILCILLSSSIAFAQNSVNKVNNQSMLRDKSRQEIRIPDINGYKALKGDFHLHTVFSDGNVMPHIRIDEAWQDGLDVIAITDHIEYRPHKDFVISDHNASYEMALKSAKDHGIHLIKATELTADKPQGGHINVLFINDANPLERPKGSPDLTQAVEEAVSQGGYLIWNHPGWAIDTCKMFPLNEKWIKEGKIKAVEVFNEKEYYPRATTWAREFKLAPMANSDAHNTIMNTYADRIQRPYNIILAKENTMESIKEAMFAGRIIAVFCNQAMATPELLTSLFESCTEVTKLPNGNYKITNLSDIPFTIQSKELNCTLEPNQSVQFKATADLQATISNLHIDEANNLETTIKIK